jgi:hypothetical protein
LDQKIKFIGCECEDVQGLVRGHWDSSSLAMSII